MASCLIPHLHHSIFSLHQSCECPGCVRTLLLRKPWGIAQDLEVWSKVWLLSSPQFISVNDNSNGPHSGFYEHQDVNKALDGVGVRVITEHQKCSDQEDRVYLEPYPR